MGYKCEHVVVGSYRLSNLGPARSASLQGRSLHQVQVRLIGDLATPMVWAKFLGAVPSCISSDPCTANCRILNPQTANPDIDQTRDYSQRCSRPSCMVHRGRFQSRARGSRETGRFRGFRHVSVELFQVLDDSHAWHTRPAIEQ